MNGQLSEWVVICVWRALLGEIFPSIRAIAISLSATHTLTLRYYLDREPTDFDFESIEVVATNISASTSRSAINHIDVDCRFSDAPIGKIDKLDGLVYCRREYEM